MKKPSARDLDKSHRPPEPGGKPADSGAPKADTKPKQDSGRVNKPANPKPEGGAAGRKEENK
jgi:hypothetical protein